MFGMNRDEWKEVNGLNTAIEIYQQPDIWMETVKIVESRKEEIYRFINEKLNKNNSRGY